MGIVESGTIVAFKWFGEKFGKQIIEKANSKVKEKWKSFSYPKAAEKYAKKMRELYNVMQVLKMREPEKLDNIYTRVNLLCKISAFQKGVKEQLEEIYLKHGNFGERFQDECNIGLNVINKKDHIFILGKPGAGKTTFLKHITIKLIDRNLSNKLKDKLPIFISLREYSDSTYSEIEEFIINQFAICNFPDAEMFIKKILMNGRAVVLFDGLDEVKNEENKRTKIVQQLVLFCKKYLGNKVIITCRIAATEYNFEGFTYVEMADFDDDQIKIFAGKWFRDNEDLKVSFLEELQTTRGKRLQVMARTPLLLTLLCIAYERNLEFPNERSEIYQDALDVLLRGWDSGRKIKRESIYKDLPTGKKHQMFAHIAIETFEKKNFIIRQNHVISMIVNYLARQPSAEIEIDGIIILRAIIAHHGIFVERAHKLYSFAHLTFQEYYAAKYIVFHAARTLKVLLNDHAKDTASREVILLTAEMLDDADEFFDIFLQSIQNYISEQSEIQKFFQHLKKKIDRNKKRRK